MCSVRKKEENMSSNGQSNTGKPFVPDKVMPIGVSLESVKHQVLPVPTPGGLSGPTEAELRERQAKEEDRSGTGPKQG